MVVPYGLNCCLIFCIFSSALGMFNFGYNTGVINAPADHIKAFIENISVYRNNTVDSDLLDFKYSVGVAIFAIGGMLGGFFGGLIANTIGRKGGMLYNCILGTLGGIILFLTKLVEVYELFFVGRFTVGISCGISTCLSPLYISELSPVTIRGALGTVNQLSVTVGILISELLGLNSVLGGSRSWEYLLGATIIPCVLQLLLLLFCPETPTYIINKKDKSDKAENVMRRLRKTENVSEEIKQIYAEEEATKVETSIKMHQLFMNKQLRKATFVAVVMQCSQQLSGINGVFYYSTSLFEKAGMPPDKAKYCNIGIGSIMVFMTLATIPLMDTLGRKTLHLSGLGGMFCSSICITLGLVFNQNVISIIFILAFVFFFAIGPGSIPWLITAELFTKGPRPAALAVATFVNWFTNFIIGLSFPSLATALGIFVFLPFTGLLLLFFLFTWFCVPETKNKSTAEIMNYFS